MKKILLYFVFILPVIAGCGISKKLKLVDFLQQQEIIAKFADLPDAPFQTKLQQISKLDESYDQLQVFYTFTMPRHDLISFYQQQMERLGWELFAESNVQDCLMHYSKPQQLCSILITENNLTIYVCNKKGA